MMRKKFNLILIFGIVLLSLSFTSALTINTTSYSINSTHSGTSGTGNISTANYQARDTITYQQAGTRNVQTSSYTANSGWFSVETSLVDSVNVTEIFFSNETVFNYSNVFNSNNITYDMNLTYIGVNCTAISGSVSNVTFNLFNTEDNITYVNETGYTFKQGDLYILNASYQIRDSGNWTLNVTCSASGGGLTDKDASLWEIAWGSIVINLINPITDFTATLYEFFTFSANVTCSGGECGVVNVTLDPEECSEVESCENISVGTECVNETVQSCDEECNVGIVEECVEEISEVCEDVCVEHEDINGTQGDCLEYREQCSDVTGEVCNEVEKEVCEEVNCTEEIIESCDDIIEQNCITEVVCDAEEVPEESGSGSGSGSSNETIGNETEIELPETSETINNGTEMPGEDFEEGEILETEEGKDLGEKTEDEAEYETYFLEMEQTEEEFKVVFYHDYNSSLSVRVEGEVNYTLSVEESDYLENVTLVVELVDGILPQFELHIGEESEVFTFGKVIPQIELKEGNYTLIDRDDLKLDVKVEFDSNESIVLRGLENEPNISVTLGTNSQEDVSSSIIAVPSLNIENATIVLEKSKGVNAIISCDDSDFDYETLECSNWKYVNVDFVEENNTIEFNVEHFTAYAGGNLTAGETAFLTIWDYNDVGMPNASTNTTDIKIYNETIEFFADYYLAKNGTKLSDGNCTIVFSDNSSDLQNMTYNSSYEYFLYERNFTSNGAYDYTVNCTHVTYTDLSESDSIVIGQFSNQTKGAVSTITGAVPFYTTSDNPQQTNNLRGGESQTISWNVNVTGILGKIYDFFVEAIGQFVSYTNSSHVNIEISANDSTIPVFVSTIVSPAAVINGSNATINANVNDNIQVDSVWANITLPDNSSHFISAGSLPYVYTTNATQTGIYTVNYYANDSSGNNATATRTFQVAEAINMSINVSVEVRVTVNVTSDVDLIVYTRGTSDEITTRENINGTETILLPNVPLDLFFNITFGNDSRSTTINNLNLSASNNGEISFSDPTVSGYLTAYAVNTSFTFDNASVEISYNNSGYTDEDNLQLHKCDNFDMVNEVCLSGFNDITSSATQDTDNDKFTYVTTSFSGFAIKQYVPPAGGDTDGGGAVSGGGVGCGSGYELIDGTCVKTAPEQLFDITFNLDDTIIQNANELSGVITFESFGQVPTPVNLTFTITDKAGIEFYREESEITVEVEELLRWNYEGLELDEGKYTAILETLYNVDVKDEFRQEFEIKEESFLAIWIWYLVGAGVILILSLIVLFIKIRKNKIRKKKPKKSFIKRNVKEISGIEIDKPKKYS